MHEMTAAGWQKSGKTMICAPFKVRDTVIPFNNTNRQIYMQTNKAPKERSTAAPITRFTLTIGEFCEATGMGRSLAYQQMQTGGLPYVKIGKRRLIPVDESRAWLKGKEVANSGK